MTRTSEAFQRLLADHGIRCSMSGQGNCYDCEHDGAAARLKRERVARRRYATRAQARADLFDYIEIFYNRQRWHSLLQYWITAEYENTLNGLT